VEKLGQIEWQKKVSKTALSATKV